MSSVMQPLRSDAVFGPKKGDTVEYLGSNDPDPYSALDVGDIGRVVTVDAIGTIFVSWKSGSRLGLVPGIDRFRVIKAA